MTRHLVALAAALCISGSQAFAQDIVMTVGAGSADVYKAPTTASPIVGHALGGMVLDVSRELGSWVKVTWPGAPDGAGYVHVSKGTVGPRKPADVARVGAAAPAPAPAPVATAPARTEPTTTTNRAALTRPVYVTPAMHIVGLGATMGGATMGFGASARAWSRKRIGAQIDVSHYAMNDALATQHVTSLQFEPSVLFSLRDTVTDYVWLRPVRGIRHQHRTTDDEQPDGRRRVDVGNENGRSGLRRFGVYVPEPRATRRQRPGELSLGADIVHRNGFRRIRRLRRRALVFQVSATALG